MLLQIGFGLLDLCYCWFGRGGCLCFGASLVVFKKATHLIASTLSFEEIQYTLVCHSREGFGIFMDWFKKKSGFWTTVICLNTKNLWKGKKKEEEHPCFIIIANKDKILEQGEQWSSCHKKALSHVLQQVKNNKGTHFCFVYRTRFVSKTSERTPGCKRIQ